jgi:hypothetical protein
MKLWGNKEETKPESFMKSAVNCAKCNQKLREAKAGSVQEVSS